MRPRAAALPLTLVAALACAAPEHSGDPEAATRGGRPKRYAFVVNNPSSFWTLAEAGVRRAAAELGVEVDFRMPQTGAVDEQQQILQDLLAREVDGIAISPIDPANMTALLDQVAARTLLVTHDSDAPASRRLAYVGTDNVAAGRSAGAEILEALPEGGEIILFVGRLDAQNARERRQGIEEALAGTAVVILDVRLDQGDQARAQENAEAMLVAHPGVDALVGLWSYNGPAILNAVRAAGKVGAVRIVCFDEEAATLDGIAAGAIDATIVQRPFEFGYRSIRLLDEIARRGPAAIPAGGIIDTGVVVVTRENVAAFRAELAEQLR
ncbi:MAG TPA: sugar-binding protein [Thermoanaerobaculia bacterium]|nr:sugar-binding protein [Thermoanaerobaculia bacterium]